MKCSAAITHPIEHIREDVLLIYIPPEIPHLHLWEER